MVRVPANTPELFKQVLDAGAWGVVVPMVNSRAEAERAVNAVRYPPLGSRSVGGGRHALGFDTGAAEYHRHANEEVLLVLQIEHIRGVENADEILSVPGVDVCFIGPNDLAASMGLGLGVSLEIDHPRIVEAIAHVQATCRKHGVATGIHCSHAAAVNQRIAQGFQFCAMASELSYMLGALRHDISTLNWTPATSQRRQDTPDDGLAGQSVRY
jgi:4-hydroxy-2-oxoheptanedioate aldolase